MLLLHKYIFPGMLLVHRVHSSLSPLLSREDSIAPASTLTVSQHKIISVQLQLDFSALQPRYIVPSAIGCYNLVLVDKQAERSSRPLEQL